jgi:hypothetical protein
MTSVYKIDQSPLYRLSNRRKLAAILEVDIIELERLANSGIREYNLFSKRTSSGKVRDIEWPKPKLFRITSKLKNASLKKIRAQRSPLAFVSIATRSCVIAASSRKRQRHTKKRNPPYPVG